MASFFESLGSLFGFQGPGQKRDLNLGQAIPSTIPELSALNQRVLGAQLGFGQDFVGRQTSPFTASREKARFRDVEEPFISSQLGARGLSRSTIGTAQLGKAAATKERDINELVAQASLQNMQQQKLDEARQQSMLFNIGGALANQRNAAAQNEQARRMQQIGFEGAADKAQQEGTSTLIGSALTLGAPFIGGAAGQALAGAGGLFGGGGGGGDQAGLLALADLLRGGRQPSATISPIPLAPDTQSLTSFEGLLGGR